VECAKAASPHKPRHPPGERGAAGGARGGGDETGMAPAATGSAGGAAGATRGGSFEPLPTDSLSSQAAFIPRPVPLEPFLLRHRARKASEAAQAHPLEPLPTPQRGAPPGIKNKNRLARLPPGEPSLRPASERGADRRAAPPSIRTLEDGRAAPPSIRTLEDGGNGCKGGHTAREGLRSGRAAPPGDGGKGQARERDAGGGNGFKDGGRIRSTPMAQVARPKPAPAPRAGGGAAERRCNAPGLWAQMLLDLLP